MLSIPPWLIPHQFMIQLRTITANSHRMKIWSAVSTPFKQYPQFSEGVWTPLTSKAYVDGILPHLARQTKHSTLSGTSFNHSTLDHGKIGVNLSTLFQKASTVYNPFAQILQLQVSGMFDIRTTTLRDVSGFDSDVVPWDPSSSLMWIHYLICVN